MSFLDKNGLQVLTTKLVQGDAIKVASHRGHTVKNVIDNITRECENVATPNTMTLENRVNEFKVGKGRDIDVSGDVEEGKVEVELKGKTYQNLCESNAKVSIQYMNDYEIEQTSEYLKVKRVAKTNSGWFYYNNSTLKRKMLKPNTTYTLFFKYESTVPQNIKTQFMQGNALNWLSNPADNQRLSTNIHRTVIKTLPSFEGKEINSQVIYFHNCEPREVGETTTIYKDMLLLEGDYSDLSVEELPSYFSGIKSSFENGVVDVEVQGKNLFDGSYRFGYLQGGDTPLYIDRDSGATRSVILKVKPNTTYNISKEYSIRNTIGLFKDYPINNTPYTPIPLNINGTRVNTGNNNYMVVYVSNESEEPWLQVEEGFVATPYEPYYKKKISFNIGEPLRSLPNGVCDEIRNNNGQWELVRRTAKVILNGSENWDNSYSGWNNKVFCCPDNYLPNIKYAPINVSNVLSTLLPPTNIGTLCSKLGYTGICTHAWSTKKLQVAKNGIETVEQLKSWLSENLMTVYYELQTPIITPIEPMEFGVKPLATMTINSDIAPISNHKIVLNRAGQIEQGIVQIAELKKRVDSLETAYDSYLLETQHKLSILGFEYELESEEI